MKTNHRLFAVVFLTLAFLPSLSRAGHEHKRAFQIVCELEQQTDHLLKDLSCEYRHRGYDLCRHRPEGRLFQAIKEMEEEVDTLHYRIRKKRCMRSQAEAFRAIRCTYQEARDLLSVVRLDPCLTRQLRHIGAHIDSLACEFEIDHHRHENHHAQTDAHGHSPAFEEFRSGRHEHKPLIDPALLAGVLRALGH